MNKFKMAAALLLGLTLAACVTINIYFPAAAAEKAADKILDDVWQMSKPEGDKKPEQKPEQKSAPQGEQK